MTTNADSQRTTPGGVTESEFLTVKIHKSRLNLSWMSIVATPARSSLPPTGDLIIEIDEDGKVHPPERAGAGLLNDERAFCHRLMRAVGFGPAGMLDTIEQVAEYHREALKVCESEARADAAHPSLPPDFGKLIREYGLTCARLLQAGKLATLSESEGRAVDAAINKARAALEAAIASLGKCSVCRGTGQCVAGPGVCICGDGSAAGELRYLHDTGARQAIALHGAALGSAEEMRERAALVADGYVAAALVRMRETWFEERDLADVERATASLVAADIRALRLPPLSSSEKERAT